MSVMKAVVSTAGAYLLAGTVCLLPLAFVEPVTVGGGSMMPALAPGDLVLVSRDAKVSPGDIGLIRERGHSAVLHRIVSVDKRGRYGTRGDANPVGDREPVAKDSVSGRVVAVIPFGKLVMHWRDLR